MPADYYGWASVEGVTSWFGSRWVLLDINGAQQWYKVDPNNIPDATFTVAANVLVAASSWVWLSISGSQIIMIMYT